MNYWWFDIIRGLLTGAAILLAIVASKKARRYAEAGALYMTAYNTLRDGCEAASRTQSPEPMIAGLIASSMMLGHDVSINSPFPDGSENAQETGAAQHNDIRHV